MNSPSIPEKANKILQLLLLILCLILGRVWYLTTIKHEESKEEALKPPTKVITLKPERGSIRDRFNEALAINQVQYNALISYGLIKNIAAITYEINDKGVKERVFKRRQYIKNLSEILAKELNLEATRIEDLIYSKAALLGSIPLKIKEDISEKEYARLRILEKDYPGILAERVPKRFYPLGMTGCDIVGYMGSISRNEYDKIMSEIKGLKEYLLALDEGMEPHPSFTHLNPGSARKRLKELQEKAYTLADFVGKTGVENSFDEILRGFLGKEIYFSNIKGHKIRKLPESKEKIAGKRLLLTISNELQTLCEALLAENEALREGKCVVLDKKTFNYKSIKQPWIKGGAIIAIDPNNAEIVAMASYPRFNPNDFIPSKDPKEQKIKRSNVNRWLESEEHLKEIWDQITPLKRERYSFAKKEFFDESMSLTWPNYLNLILEKTHPVYSVLSSYNRIENAVAIQRGGLQEALCHLSHYDQALLKDLLRLIIDEEKINEFLLAKIGKKTLEEFRQIEAAMAQFDRQLKPIIKNIFHTHIFSKWREENQSTFLKEKRKTEKELKLYPKPYLDYLDREENDQFTAFWKTNRLTLIASILSPSFLNLITDEDVKEISKLAALHPMDDEDRPAFEKLKHELSEISEDLYIDYLQSLLTFDDLNFTLLRKYPGLRSTQGVQKGKHLASCFLPKNGFGYGKSFAYRQAIQIGSLFKVVTAYTALTQTYKNNYYPEEMKLSFKELNPLTLIDDLHRSKNLSKSNSLWNVGYTMDGKPIPQLYKGGRIPRSQHSGIGQVNLQEALETSSNPYFALLAGDVLDSPNDFLEAAALFSFGEKTGIDLPGETKGLLPNDLEINKTGLYAFAIGQHSLVSTPLQAAIMLSTIANKGNVLKPNIVMLQAGKELAHHNCDILFKRQYPYKDILNKVGINLPIFTKPILATEDSSIERNLLQIKRTIFLPDSIRECLLESLSKAIHGSRGTAKCGSIRSFSKRPEMLKDYSEMSSFMVGKTSTAEVRERVDMSEDGVYMVNHIGFGAISFEDSKESNNPFENPELVVIVYLKYGDFGKEAAPIAAQIIKKWKEIKNLSS